MPTYENPLVNALLTDLYELTMMAAYYRTKQHRQRVAFEYFYREAPFHGQYAVHVGLHALVDYLLKLRFEDQHIAYLRSLRTFDEDFLAHLRDLRFRGSLEAVHEGEVLLPNIYGLRITAALEEAQFIESALLNLVNFPTLIATKASHVKFNAEEKQVLEFGLRRAQGPDGALTASRAAFIGGADASSNVAAGYLFGIPVSGTHAHSFVMFFPDELSAFDHYAEIFPNSALFLVDTYDIHEGLVNAIRVAQVMAKMGHVARGVRIDSGDLVYWSTVAHVMFEAAGLHNLKIVLSNELDERRIALIHNEIRRSVRDEGYRREISHMVGFDVPSFSAEAVIDRLIFGVGTELVTGGKESSLGGVYKLVAVQEDHARLSQDGTEWQPRIKISAQPLKVTNPGLKRVYRLLRNGFIIADIIALPDEVITPGIRFVGINPANPIQQKVYENFDSVESLHVPIIEDGKLIYDLPDLKTVKAFADRRLKTIRLESRRLENPHTLKVSLTQRYWQYKQEILEQARPN
ncbi:MAG TPA: nicotinate phosphoribosyltransferase, partial [Aggregatilineales bacterium]|nr:nicotinate phosphoribosyltransferase [Aggregatilineales bacterium]